MPLKYYVVDAFATSVFEGNPAGVCVLDAWLSEEMMQNIAAENNLAETAFAVKEKPIGGMGRKTDAALTTSSSSSVRYGLRFFTPTYEIELCGHATLATTYVLSRFYEPIAETFTFVTQKRGELTAVPIKKDGDDNKAAAEVDATSVRMFELDLPTLKLNDADEVERNPLLDEGLGGGIVSASHRYNTPNKDIICVLSSEEAVRNLKPDLTKLAKLPTLGSGFFVTARVAPSSPSAAQGFDFVTRAFFPKDGVEDPVCGSAHCSLVPYWSAVFSAEGKGAKRLNFTARQVSKRGGTLYCTLSEAGDRLKIRGNAILYSEGTLHV